MQKLTSARLAGLIFWIAGAAVSVSHAAGLNEAQFDEVLDSLQTVYTPVVAKRGLEFIVTRDWKNDQINAWPSLTATFIQFSIDGGLARQEGMTQDGLALIACHELGHPLGGFPSNGNGLSFEGQADYYATSKCLRRIFKDPSARSFTRLEPADPLAERACSAVFQDAADRAVCVRGIMAAVSAMTVTTGWGDRDPEPSLATPERYRTTVTDSRHMWKQCRLDTQVAGALCAKSEEEDLSPTDPAVGACVASQGYAAGVRPRCWYQPPAGEPDAGAN